ncbi:hypothetical protein PMZ80_006262 [Knufia obscura]|uniref:TAFII28-like protein domain-containing protein n=1 Tax=Knufia obscura TaxID=1635080 RepID=A0ABR0RL47_9EURO|nr:hypothetical protein PMZ80_006262 [Knufia obscura]
MASSPPSPFPASLPNPKKRPSMSSQVSQPASNKRPKLHPLRQTSFPAHIDANAYAAASARSETGSVANSTFSTASNHAKAAPRGRGRPRKSLQVPEDDARSARDGGSTTGRNRDSQAKSVISVTRSSGGNNPDDEPDDEEEEEEDVPENEEAVADEQKRMDEKINVLQTQMTKAQADRWNNLRSAALSSRVVKRIVNQTVSQSVTDPCARIVQWSAKALATEIVERAREVQAEWAEAMEVGIEKMRKERLRKVQEKEVALEEKERSERHDGPAAEGALLEQERRVMQDEIKKLKNEAEKYIPNKHKGGLLPDHLREALRRYKADGDGGGFGFDGLSHPLLGVQGAAAWRMGDGASGQRLFR